MPQRRQADEQHVRQHDRQQRQDRRRLPPSSPERSAARRRRSASPVTAAEHDAPAASATRARQFAGPLAALRSTASVNTGTNAAESAPSPNSARNRFGMRKATSKADFAREVPNSTAISTLAHEAQQRGSAPVPTLTTRRRAADAVLRCVPPRPSSAPPQHVQDGRRRHAPAQSRQERRGRARDPGAHIARARARLGARITRCPSPSGPVRAGSVIPNTATTARARRPRPGACRRCRWSRPPGTARAAAASSGSVVAPGQVQGAPADAAPRPPRRLRLAPRAEHHHAGIRARAPQRRAASAKCSAGQRLDGPRAAPGHERRPARRRRRPSRARSPPPRRVRRSRPGARLGPPAPSAGRASRSQRTPRPGAGAPRRAGGRTTSRQHPGAASARARPRRRARRARNGISADRKEFGRHVGRVEPPRPRSRATACHVPARPARSEHQPRPRPACSRHSGASAGLTSTVDARPGPRAAAPAAPAWP